MESKYFKDKFASLDSNNVDELSTEIKEAIDGLRRQRLKILYPKQSSKTDLMRELGLAEENNALLFLNSPQTSSSIRDKLLNSLELGKVDFCSTVFEKLLQQIPDKNEMQILKHTKPEKYSLLETVNSLYQRFSAERGLDVIDSELKELNKIELNLIEYKNSAQRGEGFTKLIKRNNTININY